MGNCLLNMSMGNKVSPEVDGSDSSKGTKDLIDEYRNNIKIGRIHKHGKEISCAIVHFKRCLEISRIVEKIPMEIEALSELGVAYHEIGQNQLAIDNFVNMYDCSKGAVDYRGLRAATLNLAAVYEVLDLNDKAIESYKEHIKLCSDTGYSSDMALVHYDTAMVYRKIDRIDTAIDHLRKAWELASKQRNWDDKLIISSELADLSYQTGKIADALQYREEQLNAAQKLSANKDMYRAYGEIGNIYFSMGKYTDAELYHNEALRKAKGIGDKLLVATTHEQLSSLYKTMKKKEDARYHKKQAASMRTHAS